MLNKKERDELIKELEEMDDRRRAIWTRLNVDSRKKSDRGRKSREGTEKKNRQWWFDNIEKVANELVRGMIVKFKGTKDGTGCREIMEVNKRVRRFNVEGEPNLMVDIIGRKLKVVRGGLEPDIMMTENGIEKLTHIRVGVDWLPIKQYMEEVR